MAMTRCTMPGRKGAALIVTLLMIVVATGLVVAFMNQVQLNRQVESTGARQIQAEILARSALTYVQGSLTEEVTRASNAEERMVSAGPARFRYRPISMAVEEVLAPGFGTPGNPSIYRMHMLPIVKQSLPGFDARCSSIRTTQPDRWGRFIAPSRWDRPTFAFSGSFRENLTPNWLYFSKDGPSAAPPFVGRVAFNVYQVDGLMDISVGGFPDTLNGQYQSINQVKGSVAGADLRTVKYFQADPALDQTLVGLRSPVASGDFVNSILNDRHGFMKPQDGDTQFVSRLDLLRFVEGSTSMAVFTPADLTAWSRSVNAPSWQPPAAGGDPNYNVFAPFVVRPGEIELTSYRDDGTPFTYTARPGDPVVARRFPLARLQWFDPAAELGDAAAFRNCFGLTRLGAGRWLYQGTAIRSLTEVAAEGREANFFELLKAAILNQSLGRSFSALAWETNVDLQVLQIGVNMIDAANASAIPTTIEFHHAPPQPFRAVGKKDLPYLSGVRFRQLVHTPTGGGAVNVVQVAVPILVNPHSQPLVASTTHPGIRVRMSGRIENAEGRLSPTGSPLSLTPRANPAPDGADEATVNAHEKERAITLLDTDVWRTPRAPEYDATRGDFPTRPGFIGGNRAFIQLAGEETAERPQAGASGKLDLVDFNLVLEYWDGANWIPYDALVGDGYGVAGLSTTLNLSSTDVELAALGNAELVGPATPYYMKPDPRTTRWGLISGLTAAELDEIPEENGNYLTVTLATDGDFPELADRDGVERLTDLKIGPGAEMGAVLTELNNPARNCLLHRRFNRVGELGIVHRGQPWKTLNFATADSADGALLDYFCITDGAADGVVAGRISLNTPRPGMLISLIENTDLRLDMPIYVTRPQQTGAQFRPTAAAGFAVPSRLASLTLDYTTLLDPGGTRPPFVTAADLVGKETRTQLYKQEREMLVRALGTAGQTRTLSFFVDIIAQSGRMLPKESTDPANFAMEGEVRLWMQVAIDRITGDIVAKHIEGYQE